MLLVGLLVVSIGSSMLGASIEHDSLMKRYPHFDWREGAGYSPFMFWFGVLGIFAGVFVAFIPQLFN